MESPLTVDNATEEELEARKAAEALGERFLVFRDDEGRQHIHVLSGNLPSVTVGRRAEADISVPWDPEMSRLHAELRAARRRVDGLRRRPVAERDVGQRPAPGRPPAARRRRPAEDRPHDLRLLRPGPDRGRADAGAGRAERHARASPSSSSASCARSAGRCSWTGRASTRRTDEEVAEATGIPLEAVAAELDHLGRALGLEAMPAADQRAEIALLAMRSGLVSADDSP